MKKEDVVWWDWNRILFGETPPIFIPEVFLGTIITFALLLVVLRLLRKKMNGKVEKVMQGTLSILVKDGVMDLKMMQHPAASNPDLFSALREQEYRNLGRAKRVYFEACRMLEACDEHERRRSLLGVRRTYGSTIDRVELEADLVDVPILSPDRGLLVALVICVTIVSLSRIVVHFSSRYQEIGSLTLGAAEKLIDDGVINVRTMERTGLSKERVFAELRSYQIFHLGEVTKLYFEANGKFTPVSSADHRPGLSNEDTELLSQLTKTYTFVCNSCGYLKDRSNKNANCPSCGRKQWKPAATNAEKLPDEVAGGQQQKELYHG